MREGSDFEFAGLFSMILSSFDAALARRSKFIVLATLCGDSLVVLIVLSVSTGGSILIWSSYCFSSSLGVSFILSSSDELSSLNTLRSNSLAGLLVEVNVPSAGLDIFLFDGVFGTGFVAGDLDCAGVSESLGPMADATCGIPGPSFLFLREFGLVCILKCLVNSSLLLNRLKQAGNVHA